MPIYYVMGVSGSGKTTLGKKLAEALNLPFFDADDYHPAENIAKMSAGTPLNDYDRKGWLQQLYQVALKHQNSGAVITCSALKEQYRVILSDQLPEVKWVVLNGHFDTILQRIHQREDHFMPQDLLQSQFDALEIPDYGIHIDVEQSTDQQLSTVLQQIQKSAFGIIGMGVMGSSLARNFARNGVSLSLYNRHVDGVEEKVAKKLIKQHDELKGAKGFDKLKNFVQSLATPRKIFLMIPPAGLDNCINQLLSYLDRDDILIDGGNTHYKDTAKRVEILSQKKLHFIGTGVSGGEEGALKGPSIMPSGHPEAYQKVAPFLEVIAAKDKNGQPCCTYIGKDGAGHFIKMVHNGIEYGEMQLLAELYQYFRTAGLSPDEIANELTQVQSIVGNSYLLEITIQILQKQEKGGFLIDKILDKAKNKGTGSWTTKTAADLGIPISTLTESLFARYISSFKSTRQQAAQIYATPKAVFNYDINTVARAYQFASIINHHQGFDLIRQASETYDWNLNLSEISRIWTNGCIIRSDLMEQLVDVFKTKEHILLHPSMANQCQAIYPFLTDFVVSALQNQVPVPCFSSSLNYFNNFKTNQSSANMIQAQRDFFGAHTYQRNDDSSGQFYHTNW